MTEFWGLMLGMLGIALAMIGTIISMMFWSRTEANSLRNEAKEDRKDFIQISRNLENAIYAIQREMADFHNRLIKIEMERK
jgi:hypothetical protein